MFPSPVNTSCFTISWDVRYPEKKQSMVKYLLNQQRPDGSWGLYYGDEGNLSTTIEAYFALKLTGESPESAPLLKAKEYILRQGGIEASRVFTKIWLALFGQYDWDKVPSMPVELVLLPSHLYFSIYEFSSWATSYRRAPFDRAEYPSEVRSAARQEHFRTLFAGAQGGFTEKIRFLHPPSFLPFRPHCQKPRTATAPVSARAGHSRRRNLDPGSSGGERRLGRNPAAHGLFDSGPALSRAIPCTIRRSSKGLKAIEDFCLEDEQGRRMQSCLSPIWDTALTALALLEAGLSPDHPALKQATSWLVSQQITSGGDWQVKNCCPPGGWAFEFVNTQYPDVDDSAVVLSALHRLSSNQTSGLEKRHATGHGLALEHAEQFRGMGGLRSQQRYGDFEPNPLRRHGSDGGLSYGGRHRGSPGSHGLSGL